MSKKRQPSISDLRVGLFVVATVVVLAVAIFTIGTRVGLLEESFVAKTYLNNVSGLKPGDLVLLGGVEVGNITDVRMSDAEMGLPTTDTNARVLEEIQALNNRLEELRSLAPSGGDLQRLRQSLQDAIAQNGVTSEQADQARRQLARANDAIDAVRQQESEIQRARANLQNIEVYMQITDRYRPWIKADSYISLGSIGLLGDKYIEVSLGRGDDPPMIVTEEYESVLGTKERTVVIVTGQKQAGFQELITGANDILANFELLSGKLVDLMGKFEEGEGTVGKFFSDSEFYDNLNSAAAEAKLTVAEATRLLKAFNEGEGTIPSLIREKELYDRINSMAAGLEESMAKVRQGEGTLGRLLHDDSIYERSDKAIENVRLLTDRIVKGEGTLGRLSVDDQLYLDLRSSIEKLSGLLADVEQGKGTLGRLAKDEQLYQNINEVSSEVVKLLYDFRQNPKRFLTIKLELF